MSARFHPIRTLQGGVVYDRKDRVIYDHTPSFEAAEELASELNMLMEGIKSYKEQDWLLYVRDNELSTRRDASELSNLCPDDELSIPGRRVA